jgi:hypothetical protein
VDGSVADVPQTFSGSNHPGRRNQEKVLCQ